MKSKKKLRRTPDVLCIDFLNFETKFEFLSVAVRLYQKILKGDFPLKKSFLVIFVLPTHTYGCEMQTYNIKIKSQLLACHKTMARSVLNLRRIEKVKYPDKEKKSYRCLTLCPNTEMVMSVAHSKVYRQKIDLKSIWEEPTEEIKGGQKIKKAVAANE